VKSFDIKHCLLLKSQVSCFASKVSDLKDLPKMFRILILAIIFANYSHAWSVFPRSSPEVPKGGQVRPPLPENLPKRVRHTKNSPDAVHPPLPVKLPRRVHKSENSPVDVQPHLSERVPAQRQKRALALTNLVPEAIQVVDNVAGGVVDITDEITDEIKAVSFLIENKNVQKTFTIRLVTIFFFRNIVRKNDHVLEPKDQRTPLDTLLGF
jgi:hypothetical protein